MTCLHVPRFTVRETLPDDCVLWIASVSPVGEQNCHKSCFLRVEEHYRCMVYLAQASRENNDPARGALSSCARLTQT